jgi:hypothetical protein
MVFLFSADRHLSELGGLGCCLLDFLQEAPLKRRSSYQTHHRDGVILLKRRVTLTGLSDGSIA